MIVSHEWLKQFVPHDMSPQEVGDLLSRYTVTLDGIESTGADLTPFVVGQVVSCVRHPNSDRLSLTKVDNGSGELMDVVCGAQNIVVGTKYPFAKTGTTMPGGITIEKRKIRGETSNGMLCSARELGLGEDHDGILALETDAAPGTPLLDVLKAGDARLNLDVLPNRPDLLSHRGVARELAAITGLPYNLLPLEGLDTSLALHADGKIGGKAVTESTNTQTVRDAAHNGITEPTNTQGVRTATHNGITITVEDSASCPHYLSVILRGVKVGESPAWLKQRLESIGVRSISNVVDFTNYVLHGYGQPVHAFDLGKLANSSIVVRPTRAGETLVTLDGIERKIETGTTVICDGARPVALAGVMGGRDSEVTDSTTDVLIEIAAFDARFVRKVRRSVNLSTDASYRFERGTDVHALEEVAALALFMLPRIAGGTVESLIYVGADEAETSYVPVRIHRVAQLIGVDLSAHQCIRHLQSIGCVVATLAEPLTSPTVADDDYSETKTIHVTAPTWRNDLNLEVDFIEEIARLHGFDALPDELRATRPGNVPDHPLHFVSRRVRDALVTAGLAEARPMPFTKTGDESLRVRNPLAEDEPYLRQSLLDTLARRAEFNLSRMQGNVRLFEIGNAFVASTDRLPREEMRVGALIIGLRRPPHFSEPQPPSFDMWDAKALAENMLNAAFPRGAVQLVNGDGQNILWSIESKAGNTLGRVIRVALDKPAWASDAYGIELNLGHMPSSDVAPSGKNAHGGYAAPVPDALRDAPRDGPRDAQLSAERLVANSRGQASGASASARDEFVATEAHETHAKYKSIPTTPAAEFDLALIVPDGTPAMDVEAVLRGGGGDLLESLVLFDEFRGPGVPAGSRSLAWRLTFRHPERTLKEKEIEGRRQSLLDTLNKKLGIKPRAS